MSSQFARLRGALDRIATTTPGTIVGDLVEAGEEAWGEERPCVRIGKQTITAARARLGEKT